MSNGSKVMSCSRNSLLPSRMRCRQSNCCSPDSVQFYISHKPPCWSWGNCHFLRRIRRMHLNYYKEGNHWAHRIRTCLRMSWGSSPRAGCTGDRSNSGTPYSRASKSSPRIRSLCRSEPPRASKLQGTCCYHWRHGRNGQPPWFPRQGCRWWDSCRDGSDWYRRKLPSNFCPCWKKQGALDHHRRSSSQARRSRSLGSGRFWRTGRFLLRGRDTDRRRSWRSFAAPISSSSWWCSGRGWSWSRCTRRHRRFLEPPWRTSTYGHWWWSLTRWPLEIDDRLSPWEWIRFRWRLGCAQSHCFLSGRATDGRRWWLLLC